MPTATEVIPEAPVEQEFLLDRVPPFLPDAPFMATAARHCCNTWKPVQASGGMGCLHGYVLWNKDIVLANSRAVQR